MSQQAVSRGPIGCSIPSVTKVCGLFTGNAGATMAADFAQGIVSVVYVSSGTFDVTFVEQPGKLLGVEGVVHTVATVAPLTVKANFLTLSQSAKTLRIEFWDLATPTLANPPSTPGTKVYLEFTFAQSSI